MKTSILAVFGKDRPGIISKVTESLFRSHCNLEDITMTVLGNQLAMMLLVSYDLKNEKKIQADIEGLGKSMNLDFFWQTHAKVKSGTQKVSNSLYLVTAIGRDRSGIVYQISKILADRGLNIQDLNSKILGSGKSKLYALALEVTLPPKISVEKLHQTFKSAGQKLGLDISLKPVERLEF